MDASRTLIDELRTHALVVGEVVLTSGATAQYYVDAKRAMLRPAGFAAMGELIAARAPEWGADAVGGLTMGADAPACAALAGGADVNAFFVRKEAKAHGLQRRIEGPPLEPRRALPHRRGRRDHGRLDAPGDRGGARRGPRGGRRRHRSSTASPGGGEAIRAAVAEAPYEALATIDDVYPERPDRA